MPDTASGTASNGPGLSRPVPAGLSPSPTAGAPAPMPPAPHGLARELLELISSMRFAIALLTLICIASVIGTVVKQGEPLNNYVNAFGPFWAEVFVRLGIATVYSAPWFLAILGFLVLSTSLCIARNLPKILSELRTYKEGLREQALAAFHHKGTAVLPLPRKAALAHVAGVLKQGGWQARVQPRRNGVMVAARKGASHKLGYLAAHSAIVLICLGGLLDGDLIVRLQMALRGKQAFAGGGLISEVPAKHRLPAGNPTFRGNLLVPEGARAGVAVLNMPDGVVLQDLPFDVELKRFIVQYYPTGMPKLFASEIVLHDHDTGQAQAHTVEVNKPVFHRGVAIYQSSFDDGGSSVTLRAWPLPVAGQARAAAPGFEVAGRIGEKTELDASKLGGPADASTRMTLEFTGLRVINVENFGEREEGSRSGADPRRVDLTRTLDSHLGSAAKPSGRKELRNIGPSITYRLRDAAGQATEFNNYMAPVEIDGSKLFLVGARASSGEGPRYLRIPADERGQLDGWWRLRQALAQPAERERAARRYVAQAVAPDKPEMAEQLRATAQRALALFAGAEAPRKPPEAASAAASAGAGAASTAGAASAALAASAAEAAPPAGEPVAGLQALSDFIDTLPE